MNTRTTLGLLLVAASIGCDQGTKALAVEHLSGRPTTSYLFDTFRLGYAENPGAFLSLGAGLSPTARFWIFTAGSAVLLGVIVIAALRKRLDAVPMLGLLLVAAGGIGNLVDRVLRDGRVVDFMNMGIGPVRTGIFNVADVQLMAGVALIAFGDILTRWISRSRSR